MDESTSTTTANALRRKAVRALAAVLLLVLLAPQVCSGRGIATI